MAGLFEKGYNKFVDYGNSLNNGTNKVVGKKVFGEMKHWEDEREYQAYDSFAEYSVPEPEQWGQRKGTAKEFMLDGNVISVSENLDVCVQYIDLFKASAKYYADRFEFKYHQCVTDYDTLLHYFEDMYTEGLKPMVARAYELLLPFGVFNVSRDVFTELQLNTYNRAITSYYTVFNIKEKRNQEAANLGNKVGTSVQLQGGGFGFRGAMKGIAKAELFNTGMGLAGKFVANQTRMSDEEKEKLFKTFKADVFFKEVYSDYFNTFRTFIQILSDNGVLENVSTVPDEEFRTIVSNLKSPMFPQDKVSLTLVKLISSYPFSAACYEIVKQRYGDTEEGKKIIEYFAL